MIHTNWYVITGPPCSGKTTTVERLQQKGYAVHFEITRKIIEDLLREGGPRVESVLQRKVLQAKVEIEEKTPLNQLVFFDTTIACNLPYYEDAGLPGEEVQRVDGLRRYQGVFFMEHLPEYMQDAVRRENREEAFQKGQRILREYQRLGYDVMAVPVMSIEERVRFVLGKM